MAETSNTQRDGSNLSVIRKNLLLILGFPSAIVGMAFLAISSFSEKQFVGNHQSLHCLVFVVVTGLFVAFIFSGRRINSCLETVCRWRFSMKALINGVSFVIVSVLTFLIKYPRFNIHSALLTGSNCIFHEVERNEISQGNQFNLFSVGAFSLLAFLMSFERHKPTDLGFSSLLLGLTIDASMEIPGRDGPNLRYIFGAALYCIFLIFLSHYVTTQLESTNKNTFLPTNLMSERQREMFLQFLKLLELISAALGIFFLSVCPFSKNQFGDDTAVLEVSFIAIFALLLGYFMSNAPGFICYLANQCHNNRLVKAMVSSLLLMIFSVFIFLTKYPRFQIHSKHKESCANLKKGKELPHGSQFDLYSAAAFSLVALTISSEKDQSTELGIFHFLLELTMDASIETLENNALNLWYMGVAVVYCFLLIFARIYLAPSEKDEGRSCSSNLSSTKDQQQRELRIQIRDHGLEDGTAGVLLEDHKPENNSEGVLLPEDKPKEGRLLQRKKGLHGIHTEDKTYKNYKMLKPFDRNFKIKDLGPPNDVKRAFSYFTDGEAHMSADQLRRFMAEHHGEVGVTLAEAEEIVRQVLAQKYNAVCDETTSTRLGLDDFFYLLFHDDFNGPYKSEVHLEMTAPLSHYFIYSGHNSYLSGNLPSSDCSEVPIIKALLRGVRGIELDLWKSSKDDINVFHGRTLTTPVPLIDCLKSIKEYAFVKSPYPVVITLEDHLTPDLQAKVAEMIRQTLGDMLYYPRSECLAEFPSPESLKHKIIISTKPPKKFMESRNLTDMRNILPNGKQSSEEEISGKDSLDGDLTVGYEADDSDRDQDDEENNGKSSQPAAAPEYKRLITMHAGKPKGGLKEALKVTSDKVRCLSLNVQALEKAAASHATDLVRFTQRNVLRVYPKGIGVDSSYFNPIIGWMHGAQMVAFNMQGNGKSLWLMHGMFRANGGCGYVKKPNFLMQKGPSDEVFDPRRTLPVKKTIKVKVYMGVGWRFHFSQIHFDNLDFSQTHDDTYSPPDFYTKVNVVGVPADCAKKRTKIIDDDWAPVWDEEFTFPLTVPELALLTIEVRESDGSEKDGFGGQTCFPVSDIKPGIRGVPLYNEMGEKFESVKLLIRFQFV